MSASVITFKGLARKSAPQIIAPGNAPFALLGTSPVMLFGSSFERISTPRYHESSSHEAEGKTPDESEEKNISQPPPIYFNTTPPQPSKDPAPDLVKAIYRNDLNILKIHEAIRASFASKLGHVNEAHKNIKKQRANISSGFMTLIESQKLQDQITVQTAEIEKLVSGELWIQYIQEAQPIIIEYLPLASNPIRGIVKFRGGRAPVQLEDSDLVSRRLEVIDRYLDVARKYIALDIVHDAEIVSRCPNCGTKFEDMLLDEDVGIHTCECGYERVNLAKASTYKDSSRVNIAGKSQYEDRMTFVRAFERHQGQKSGPIPDRLYTMLDEYFTRKGFPIGEQIRNTPSLPNGKKPRTSVDLMSEALSATGNAAYYDSIQTIAHNYWGWILPDYSEYREGIIADYDATQKIYEEIKERESSLNVQIRLYVQLKARGCPCEWSDFKILSSRESLEYHHRMWKIMCERTGIKFTPII